MGKSFGDLRLKAADFDRSVDDALYGSWINEDKGFGYYFQNLKLFLPSKDYFPKNSDDTLRCNGFPPYKPGGEYPYIEIANFYDSSISKKEDLSNIFARFENFIINFRSINVSNNYKGYVLIYFDKKLSFKEYERRLTKVKYLLYNKRKVSPKQIIIIESGLRDESQVEFYILSKERKPPAPKPTLPSPQFMKKQ